MNTILDRYVAIAGIDWADKKHDICLLDRTMTKPSYFVIQHKPEAIDSWVQDFQHRYPGERIAICIELSKDPIISALLNYDFIDIYEGQPGFLIMFS
ncbi:MAG: hypothetical protein V3T17_06555 [Pseudomonadales bacterium]